MLLLRTIGARSGTERVNPLKYQDLGGSVAVFATRVERLPTRTGTTTWLPIRGRRGIGNETRRFPARTAMGAERDPIWTKQKRDYPGFAEYESQTVQVIPVVILEPR